MREAGAGGVTSGVTSGVPNGVPSEVPIGIPAGGSGFGQLNSYSTSGT